MLRIVAVLVGIALIVAGVAAFLPQYQVNELFLSYFQVSNLYNVIFISCGVIAIIAAASSILARIYFQLLGLTFAAGAILGFLHNGDLLFFQVNLADNIVHISIAVVALLVGFVFHR